MSRMSDYDITLQTVVGLGLCSKEEALKLSIDELDKLINDFKNKTQ